MKYVVIIILLGLIGCDHETGSPTVDSCSTEAVIKDLTGLDGCGYILELNDGTRLIPERRTYIQAPSKEDDPIYYFQMSDGHKVKISYRPTQLLGTCMAGEIVFITCISSLEPTGL